MDIDFDELDDRTLQPGADTHPDTARLLADLDRKRAARQLALPTNDQEVRNLLRAQGEPVTLFGERPEDRRDRLRSLLAKARQAEGQDEPIEYDESEGSSDEEMEDEEKEEEFYTEGTLKLKEARRYMAEYSIPRSQKRIARQRRETQLPLGRLMDVRKAVYGELKRFTNLGSQIGDTRTLSSLRFSPDSSMLLTASWTGLAKLWTVPGCKELRTIKAHKERIGGVAWHPQATLSQSATAVNFATSGADNDVKLWSLEGGDAPLQTLSGHSGRVCRIGFHPSGKFLGSASYDGTWRLWDTETGGEELLLQEGHSKEVYAIAFQQDGALVCTGGLDAIGRVWDLRSGKTAMVLDGHVKDILAIDFAPNGHQIATGSNDDTVRIWDMRSLKAIYTIPAHKSAVSDLKFFTASAETRAVPRAFAHLDAFSEQKRDPVEVEGERVDYPLDGSFLVSSGYDGAVKVWSADDWQHVRTLSNDAAGKVMSVDISADARFIASAEYTRSFKLWSSPDVDLA